jgi:adenylate cyclase
VVGYSRLAGADEDRTLARLRALRSDLIDLASALGHLGRVDDARRIWHELKEINPRYSHVDHIGRLPFKNSADADKFTDGLRKAGLAE